MIIDKLKFWEYYKRKIPIYLLNSYGFEEHFKMLFDLLVQLDSTEDSVMKAFDILNETYLDYINNLPDATESTSDILEKIAELFGVSRNFDIDYIEDGTDKKASLSLTNSELLKLIKARIIQNNYQGTYEESREFYTNMNLPVYLFQSGNPAEVYVLLDNSAQLTDNEQKMFLSNLFTIKSMGITYHTYITDVLSVMIWDTDSSTRYWDTGRWL